MTDNEMEEIKDMMEATVEHFSDEIGEKVEKHTKPIVDLLEVVIDRFLESEKK